MEVKDPELYDNDSVSGTVTKSKTTRISKQPEILLYMYMYIAATKLYWLVLLFLYF